MCRFARNGPSFWELTANSDLVLAKETWSHFRLNGYCVIRIAFKGAASSVILKDTVGVWHYDCWGHVCGTKTMSLEFLDNRKLIQRSELH